MTRQTHEKRDDTSKVRCKNVTQKRTSRCRKTIWKQMLKVDTTLREDWNDLPVLVPEYYNDTGTTLDNEQTKYRYYPEPPKWDDSPRSSMHIINVPTSSNPIILPPNIPGIGLQKKVQFTTEPTKVYIVDYSSSASSTWYNRTEYTKFKSDLKETIVALYRTGGHFYTLDKNQHTFTGLERSLTHRQITARKKLYTMYIQVILQQQEYCSNDPIQLRNLSMIYTNSSALRAHIRGMMDHEFLNPKL